MANMSPFCTCDDLECPHHPTNHDKGCMPCIVKNLHEKEIPSCFFYDVDQNLDRPSFFYEDFAQAVIKQAATKDEPAAE